MIAASERMELGTANTFALGYHDTTTPTYNGTDQNLTVKLEGTNGNGTCEGAWTGGGADYAELMPNVSNGVIPPGSLVTRVGKAVKPAKSGDRVLGVVSGSAGFVGNAAALSWAGRYMRDEFGGYQVGTHSMVRWADFDGLESDAPGPIPSDAERYEVTGKIENPDFDASQIYQPRKNRPEEWSTVGLVGQILTRVDSTVDVDDFITAGSEAGRGTASSSETRIECMEITSPFDSDRGYAVALVLIR